MARFGQLGKLGQGMLSPVGLTVGGLAIAANQRPTQEAIAEEKMRRKLHKKKP
ncbi:Uncharacterised protein [Rodentibacter pneumotropicus]|uniref:Uncharacterized protein n=1 Tax=Rodentibacter pneumotropicus TaxID=758 RepID=A0A3S4TVT8_9PAST|nr:Uncharacterised protein [Rodentibacter pneumotropicus]